MSKQNRNRFVDTENILMVARREGVGGMDEKCEGIGDFKIVMGI